MIEQQLESAGLRSRMLVDGSGPIVLFLHGAGGIHLWPDFLRRLSPRYTVWHPEHPGFGLSEEAPDIHSYEDLARYYVQFLRQRNVDAVHVIGSSVGGWLAGELAAALGPAALSLTVLAPAGISPRSPSPAPPPSEQEYFRRLYVDQAIAERMLATIDENLRSQQIRSRKMAARLAGPSFCDPHLHSRLSAVQCPSLIVWGEQDKLVPAGDAALWARSLAASRVSILAPCGHLPHFEMPQAVSRLVVSFIDEMQDRALRKTNVPHP